MGQAAVSASLWLLQERIGSMHRRRSLRQQHHVRGGPHEEGQGEDRMNIQHPARLEVSGDRVGPLPCRVQRLI